MSSKNDPLFYKPSACGWLIRRALHRPWPLLIAVWALLGHLASAQFVYINNNSIIENAVSAFQVDAYGNLTPIPSDGTPFPTGGAGGACEDIGSMTQVGSRLYVSNSGGSISGFDINPNGSLTLININPFPVLGPTLPSVAGLPVGVAASTDGNFLFVGRGRYEPGAGIDVYRINADDGSLSLVLGLTGSPFGVGGEVGFDVLFDPDRSIVISDVTALSPGLTGFVGVFSFDPDTGALTPVARSPFVTPSNQNHKMALQGDCLFIAGGLSVSAMQINSEGSLANAPTSPINTGDYVIGVTVAPPGDFVYFGGTESIRGFRINDACALTAPSVFFGVGPFPGLTTDRSGDLLFAVGGDNRISSFTIDSAGGLTLADSKFIGSAVCPGGIVYVELPAGPPGSPPTTPCVKVTGHGKIAGLQKGTAKFNFKAEMKNKNGKLKGRVHYEDASADLKLKSIEITEVVVIGNQAQISGKARVNGEGSYQFVVKVQDNEETPTPDQFHIEVIEVNGYSNGGPVRQGDIEIEQDEDCNDNHGDVDDDGEDSEEDDHGKKD